MHGPFLVVSGLLAVVLAGGCGSAPTPTAAPASTIAGGTECAGLPTLGGPSPAPSFQLARDPELEAAFPAEIAGEPVTNLQSARLIETMCLFGGQAGVDGLRSQAPLDFDLSNLYVASAATTIEGSTVRISAFHRPDGDVAQLLESIRGLTRIAAGDPDKFSGELTETVVGGKAVQTWTDPEGVTSYLYAADDVLFVVDGVTPSQADQVFTAF